MTVMEDPSTAESARPVTAERASDSVPENFVKLARVPCVPPHCWFVCGPDVVQGPGEGREGVWADWVQPRICPVSDGMCVCGYMCVCVVSCMYIHMCACVGVYIYNLHVRVYVRVYVCVCLGGKFGG